MYASELRADFQQFYGLNIDRMGADYSILHAADIAVQLPYEARVWTAIRKERADQEAKQEEEQKAKERPFSVSIDEYEQLINQEWEDEDA